MMYILPPLGAIVIIWLQNAMRDFDDEFTK